MNRFIVFIGVCFLGACNQNAKPTEVSKVTSMKADTTDIDPVTVSPDKYKILLENEHVSIVEYTLKPGEKDKVHNHPAKTEYTISGGTLRVYPENKEPFDVEELTGSAFWSDKTTRHYVENIGSTTIKILLTEIKSVQ